LLLANENSRPFAIIAGLLALIAFLFPIAWTVAGVCIIIAIFRIFF
jgi:hypothetical protein